MKAFTRILCSSTAAALLLAAAVPAAAQKAKKKRGERQSTEAEGMFFESVDVNVVNVEVFVTDAKGEPIRGLTREDFTLFEDGQPVEISNFLAVAGDRVASAPGMGEDEAAAEALAVPKDQRLHVVLLLDNLNIHPRDRNQVLTHLRRFLREGLDNQDRVMLSTFDGSLHVVKEFTSIPELIQPLIEQSQISSGRGNEIEIAQRQIIREIEEAALDTNNQLSQGDAEIVAGQLLSAIRVHAQQVMDRTRLTLDAMKALIDSLAGLPGRKALVYVSGGLPLRPSEGLFEAWNRKFNVYAGQLNITSPTSEMLAFDSTDTFRDLVAHANGNRVVLYTIDAVRNRSFGSVSPEVGGLDLATLTGSGGGRVWSSDLDSRANSNYRQPLRMLAEDTGGLSFVNTKGLGTNLASLATDFGTFYSLGYTPPAKGDGKYHRLEVRLADKKYRLRHRAGYQDKSSSQRMSDRTLSALLLNSEDNPLGVTIERAQGVPEEEGIYDVPFLVKVPMSSLALLPQEGFHQGKVSIFVVVRDAKDRTSPVKEIPLPIRIPNGRLEEVLGQFAGYTFNVRMREGFQKVAIGVRDEIASVESTVRLSFLVGPDPVAPAMVLGSAETPSLP